MSAQLDPLPARNHYISLSQCRRCSSPLPRRLSNKALNLRGAWHRLTESESFKYRDELNRFSGCSERVEDWGKEMWEQKVWSRRIHWRLAAKNKPAEALAISTDGTQTDLQNRINAHFNAHLRFKEDLIYFFIHV